MAKKKSEQIEKEPIKKASKPKITKAVPVTASEQTVAQAIKHYIWTNFGKMSIEELARNTGLDAEAIEKVATSSELDKEPVLDEKDKNAIQPVRRFLSQGGSVQMTPQQSMLDDKEYTKNLPNLAEINARIPGVSTIERRKV
jgi:hypothetical protein